MTGINKDEWLSAVKAANEAPLPASDAITLTEFGQLMGVERSQAGKRMRGLVQAGKATPTKKQTRRADGGIIWVPAYRLVKTPPPTPAKKRK